MKESEFTRYTGEYVYDDQGRRRRLDDLPCATYESYIDKHPTLWNHYFNKLEKLLQAPGDCNKCGSELQRMDSKVADILNCDDCGNLLIHNGRVINHGKY